MSMKFFLMRLFGRSFWVKLSLIAGMMAAAFPSWAEEPPSWYQGNRSVRYPQGLYFTGYVDGKPQEGESMEDAVNRLKKEAQVEAASSIRMTVEKTLTDVNRSELIRSAGVLDEQVTEYFESYTQIKVGMEIPGMKVEVWKNEKKQEIAAFAYVKKSELVKKLERQITAGNTKAEMVLENVERLVEESRKQEARKMLEEGLLLFDDMEQAQVLLLAVDAEADLQLEETVSLKLAMQNRLSDLRHAIRICLISKADFYGSSYDKLQNEIQGILSADGCSFVTEPEQADWVISIEAAAREYNQVTMGGSTTYFAYVDARISIDKVATGQRIYKDEITVKGGHTLGYEEAARSAYKQAGKKIGNVIRENIN